MVDYEQAVIDALESVATALEKLLSGPGAIPPWIGDVIWRWLACWFEGVGNRVPPSGLFRHPKLAMHVAADDFLLASAVQYGFRSEKPYARDQLAHFLDGLMGTAKASTAAPVVLGRLVAAYAVDEKLSWSNLRAWMQLILTWQVFDTFAKEYRTCRQALEHGLLGLDMIKQSSPRSSSSSGMATPLAVRIGRPIPFGLISSEAYQT